MLLPDELSAEALLARTNGRWQICPLWVLRGTMFTLAEKALIIALLDLWHTTGRPEWFFGTAAQVAGLMGCSERTFRTARAGLLKKQLIGHQRGRQHTASRYQFSQDFLYSLASSADTNSSYTTLKTSTYSNGAKITGLNPDADAQTRRF